MEVHTTRFGRIEFVEDDLLRFPEGLPGLEDCRDWVLVQDADSDAVAWLQSASRPETALAVVSPRRFVPGYQLRVCRQELEPLRLSKLAAAQVLAILSKTERGLTLNLKAPLVIDLERRQGRQVLANGAAAMQHLLGRGRTTLKKTA